jgi:hypothetical protein
MTAQLLNAAAHYWIGYRFSIHFEVGVEAWGRRRVDLVALDFKADRVIFCEIKSGHADFSSDDKWRTYLPYCHKFYFVVPASYWNSKSSARLKREAKEEGAGVLVVSGRGATLLQRHGAGRPALPPGFKKKLVTKLAWRSGIHRHNCRATLPVVEYSDVE